MRYRIRETSSSVPDGNWTAKLWLIVSSTPSTCSIASPQSVSSTAVRVKAASSTSYSSRMSFTIHPNMFIQFFTSSVGITMACASGVSGSFQPNLPSI
jgi:hypothetical protein